MSARLVIGGRGRAPRARRARFAGTDADGGLDGQDENLAVADAPRLGCVLDRFHRSIDAVVRDHELDLDLRQEVHDVFGAAIKLGMALLAAKALRLGDGQALQPDFLKGFLHVIELERLNDSLDLLHEAGLLDDRDA